MQKYLKALFTAAFGEGVSSGLYPQARFQGLVRGGKNYDKPRRSKYTPHQGKQEIARRLARNW